LADLREKYPGAVGLYLPTDAWKWAPQDLENYFESGGFIKPKGFIPEKPASPPKRTTVEKRESAKKQASGPDVPQFSVAEAQRLQDQLFEGFRDKDFQMRLLNLQSAFPNRKTRGHADGAQYFDAFEMLAMTVYARVLPKYDLLGDWDGVRDMYAKMETALMHPKVKKNHEELNTLLGLPRDAKLSPGKKAEEVFAYRPRRDGATPGYPLPVVFDDEGDAAHEFFVEDDFTGELQSHIQSTDSWYRVVARNGALVRAKPDTQSEQVGKRVLRERVRVQRVLSGKWLLLHDEELKKLKLTEAWLGADTGLGDLVEKISSLRAK